MQRSRLINLGLIAGLGTAALVGRCGTSTLDRLPQARKVTDNGAGGAGTPNNTYTPGTPDPTAPSTQAPTVPGPGNTAPPQNPSSTQVPPVLTPGSPTPTQPPPSSSASPGGIADECGVGNLSDPNAPIYQRTLRSDPIRIDDAVRLLFFKVKYSVNITAILNIDATLLRSVTSRDFEVSARSAIVENRARAEVDKLKVPSTSYPVPFERTGDFFQAHPEWNGIVCTLSPTERVETTVDGHPAVLRFSPAIPLAVSPKASLARYQAELKDRRTFSNITVTIETQAPSIPRQLTGTIVIEPLTPLLSANSATAPSQDIRGDVAYRITSDFGQRELAERLGILGDTTYYIDTAKRDFAGIVSVSSRAEIGRVIFRGI